MTSLPVALDGRCRTRRGARAAAACLALCWSVAAQGASTALLQLPDTIAQRALACTGCHGKEGRATNQGYFPRIAGKPAGYLYNQLINFREGRRSNAAMTYLVEHLSEPYLQEIAAYFSALDLPYPPPQTVGAAKDTMLRGETLALKGDASRELPACVRCHGAALTGVAPSIPGLLGLPRDYLASQLGGWKTGQRHAAAPDCMAQITRRLSPEDISAVVTWLSSQPVPKDARPATAIEQPQPLSCGTEVDHPRSAFGAPPQGGAPSGPAKPDPRRPLDVSVHAVGVLHGAVGN